MTEKFEVGVGPSVGQAREVSDVVNETMKGDSHNPLCAHGDYANITPTHI